MLKYDSISPIFEGYPMNTYEALDVAHAILSYQSMSHKKLQKLCYYAQTWSYGVTGSPLMHSHFEAWIHGPVTPELYSTYKVYGWESIPKTDKFPESMSEDLDVIKFLDEIFRIYGDMDGDQLELLTHEESPWLNARSQLPSYIPSNNRIKKEDMIEFCQEKLAE